MEKRPLNGPLSGTEGTVVLRLSWKRGHYTGVVVVVVVCCITRARQSYVFFVQSRRLIDCCCCVAVFSAAVGFISADVTD